jgi:ribonuclease E
MPNKMLIDSSHPEETRVVVVRGNRIEEFDFESQDKKQLKGNIYLARVTRVEPSLQAAFVEYGGNRHGFLAFSEIHPDYYQIPVADRQALLRAEAEEEDDEDEENDERERGRGNGNRKRRRGSRSRDRGDEPARASSQQGASAGAAPTDGDHTDDDADRPMEAMSEETVTPDESVSEAPVEIAHNDAPEPGDDEKPEGGPTSIAAEVEVDVVSEKLPEAQPSEGETGGAIEEVHSHHHDDEHEVESVGAEDALEEVRNRRKPPRRHYKIQEVIKRRQILLVQVVKEERGNKGAALTTYLSLAGRYSVLMPNTARGGGISRKITNATDRKRLKEVVADLEVPQGMGVILRTAGESRTKAEIKRDYEYLMRLWENVRSLTLQSTAPALVYEEGSLIKRSVRDLYNKDIDEVLVAGDDGYREAKDFMRMLMPSHAKVVQPYRDTTPLFARFGVESQLDRMLQPQVTLKSGGYIIINQTEALVAIDVNSGRSTKEHSIEETALHTNLEAAEEVARQLRLRDMAGLIVIDFIDMEENRNNRAVEKRLKDHLKNDRARIQLGRISHFGLMEMSRQRIRASVLESTMKPCPHCGGTGHVRSDSSVALLVVRAIEEFLLKDSRHHITVKTPSATALYVLNHKRSTLAEIEARFGVTVTIDVDETVGAMHYAIVRGAVAEKPIGFQEQQFLPPLPVEEEDDVPLEAEDEEAPAVSEQQRAQPAQQPRHAEGGEDGNRKRRRRRRRRGGRDRDHNGAPHDGQERSRSTGQTEGEMQLGEADAASEDSAAAAGDDGGVVAVEATAENGDVKKRRRGKRGGKRNRKEGDEASEAESAQTEDLEPSSEAGDEIVAEAAVAVEATETAVVDADEPVKPKRARRSSKASQAAQAQASEATLSESLEGTVVAEAEMPAAVAAPAAAVEEAEPSRPSRRKPEASAPPVPVVSSILPEGEPAKADEQPKKGGWWQRRSFF